MLYGQILTTPRVHGESADSHGFSLVIDRGNPSEYFLGEPLPNGGRINIGAYGNTPEAQVSPASELVQVLSPNGLEKYEVGQQLEIQSRSYGLGQRETVMLMNVGGGTVLGGAQGDWLAHAYAATSYYTSTISSSDTINTGGVLNPAPESVYRQYAYSAGSSVGDKLGYHLPVPDGAYIIRLHFAEPSYSTSGYRLMDINLQGVLVANDYDLVASAGGR